MPWPRRPSRIESGLGRRGGDLRGVGDVRVPASPDRTGRRVRRGRLVQRLEGHHAARRDHGDPRVRQRRAAGRRPQQGSRSGQPGTRARSGEGGRRARRSGVDHPRRIRPMVPGRGGHLDDGTRSPRLPIFAAPGRHRAAVAGLCQLRLVSRRRLSGARRRLQTVGTRPLRETRRDELVDHRHRRPPQAGARARRSLAPASDAAHGVEAGRPADGRVLRDRRRRRRLRHARSGDGAVGVVDQPVPPGLVAVPDLQQAGDVGGLGSRRVVDRHEGAVPLLADVWCCRRCWCRAG